MTEDTKFWILLVVTILPGLSVLALQTVMRRENKTEYANKLSFDDLKHEVDAIPTMIEKMDKESKESRNAEFRELRELIKELRILFNSMQGDNNVLKTQFAVFEKDMSRRIEILERAEEERRTSKRERTG